MRSSKKLGEYTNDNKAKFLDLLKANNYKLTQPSMERSYDMNSGVYVSPLSDPDATSVVVFRLHNKVGFSTVNWSATKVGSPPICPAPTDAFCSKDVIQEAQIRIAKPQSDRNGGCTWSMAGTYTYIQTEVRDENSHYEVGISPMGDPTLLAITSTDLGSGLGAVAGGAAAAALATMQSKGFSGEYPQALFQTDSAIPMVDFGKQDYTYAVPVFSNQFFSSAMVI